MADDPKLSKLTRLDLHRLYFQHEKHADDYMCKALAKGQDVLVTRRNGHAPLYSNVEPSSDSCWIMWMFRRHWPNIGLSAVAYRPEAPEEALTDRQATLRQRMTVLDRQSIRALPPVEWLVKGIVRAKAIGMIFNAPKSYKSFVVLDMAWALAEGRDWADGDGQPGFKVREACDVLYLYGESLEGLQRRLRARALSVGRDPDNWPERLRFMGYVPRICDDDEYRVFRSILDEMDSEDRLPRLLIFDTFTRVMVGFDQKSDEDVSLFYFRARELVRDYDLTVFVVHHTGHSNTHREFGSSVHYREIDFRLKVEADKAAMVAEVVVLDQKEDAEFTQGIGLKAKAYEVGRDEDGDQVTSLAFKRAPVVAAKSGRSDIERMLRLSAAREVLDRTQGTLTTKALAHKVTLQIADERFDEAAKERLTGTVYKWFLRLAKPNNKEHNLLASLIVTHNPLEWGSPKPEAK